MSGSVELLADPVASAKAAGLRYVSDEMPGITRKLRGKHFVFAGPNGKAISDEVEIARIRALAVPPAYTDVWICPVANGHLQATGRDARGRKQYRYHKRWRELRDETKFDRMVAFAQALPGIRKRVEDDLKREGMPREKVLAAIVRLLEGTSIRVGNEEYARDNKSYGLTTIENRHVKVQGANVRFSFRGKSGVKHAIDFTDRRLAKIVRQCQDLPGQQLFGYLDDSGAHHDIGSADVNDYIRQLAGDDFSAKDFRTWAGTVGCALLLSGVESQPDASTAERKLAVTAVIKDVAARLGNTPAVCRKCYVHPHVIDMYMEEGALGTVASLKAKAGLLAEERFVLNLLRTRAKESDASRTSGQLRRSLAKRKASPK
ncbi:MAG: DNA topoisomerase IB [Candidatus Eremiobacteraeota bacterium]|nr:DNA topoisomerase IB [Candidatus Eremiobacteraeota bacterium]